MTDAVAIARSWIGTPYRHQASVKGVGCDCLGLLRGVWRELRGAEPERVPAYTPDWGEAQGAELLLAAARRHLLEASAPRPGDVLVFRMRARSVAKHVGLMAGPASFVHAYDRCGVVESPLSAPWAARIAGVFRFPD